jgi:hypothetical protein
MESLEQIFLMRFCYPPFHRSTLHQLASRGPKGEPYRQHTVGWKKSGHLQEATGQTMYRLLSEGTQEG